MGMRLFLSFVLFLASPFFVKGVTVNFADGGQNDLFEDEFLLSFLEDFVGEDSFSLAGDAGVADHFFQRDSQNWKHDPIEFDKLWVTHCSKRYANGMYERFKQSGHLETANGKAVYRKTKNSKQYYYLHYKKTWELSSGVVGNIMKRRISSSYNATEHPSQSKWKNKCRVFPVKIAAEITGSAEASTHYTGITRNPAKYAPAYRDDDHNFKIQTKNQRWIVKVNKKPQILDKCSKGDKDLLLAKWKKQSSIRPMAVDLYEELENNPSTFPTSFETNAPSTFPTSFESNGPPTTPTVLPQTAAPTTLSEKTTQFVYNCQGGTTLEYTLKKSYHNAAGADPDVKGNEFGRFKTEDSQLSTCVEKVAKSECGYDVDCNWVFREADADDKSLVMDSQVQSNQSSRLKGHFELKLGFQTIESQFEDVWEMMDAAQRAPIAFGPVLAEYFLNRVDPMYHRNVWDEYSNSGKLPEMSKPEKLSNKVQLFQDTSHMGKFVELGIGYYQIGNDVETSYEILPLSRVESMLVPKGYIVYICMRELDSGQCKGSELIMHACDSFDSKSDLKNQFDWDDDWDSKQWTGLIRMAVALSDDNGYYGTIMNYSIGDFYLLWGTPHFWTQYILLWFLFNSFNSPYLLDSEILGDRPVALIYEEGTDTVFPALNSDVFDDLHSVEEVAPYYLHILGQLARLRMCSAGHCFDDLDDSGDRFRRAIMSGAPCPYTLEQTLPHISYTQPTVKSEIVFQDFSRIIVDGPQLLDFDTIGLLFSYTNKIEEKSCIEGGNDLPLQYVCWDKNVKSSDGTDFKISIISDSQNDPEYDRQNCEHFVGESIICFDRKVLVDGKARLIREGCGGHNMKPCTNRHVAVIRKPHEICENDATTNCGRRKLFFGIGAYLAGILLAAAVGLIVQHEVVVADEPCHGDANIYDNNLCKVEIDYQDLTCPAIYSPGPHRYLKDVRQLQPNLENFDTLSRDWANQAINENEFWFEISTNMIEIVKYGFDCANSYTDFLQAYFNNVVSNVIFWVRINKNDNGFLTSHWMRIEEKTGYIVAFAVSLQHAIDNDVLELGDYESYIQFYQNNALYGMQNFVGGIRNINKAVTGKNLQEIQRNLQYVTSLTAEAARSDVVRNLITSMLKYQKIPTQLMHAIYTNYEKVVGTAWSQVVTPYLFCQKVCDPKLETVFNGEPVPYQKGLEMQLQLPLGIEIEVSGFVYDLFREIIEILENP